MLHNSVTHTVALYGAECRQTGASGGEMERIPLDVLIASPFSPLKRLFMLSRGKCSTAPTKETTPTEGINLTRTLRALHASARWRQPLTTLP